MLTRILKLIMSILFLGLVAGKAWAASDEPENPIVPRDQTLSRICAGKPATTRPSPRRASSAT